MPPKTAAKTKAKVKAKTKAKAKPEQAMGHCGMLSLQSYAMDRNRLKARSERVEWRASGDILDTRRFSNFSRLVALKRLLQNEDQ